MTSGFKSSVRAGGSGIAIRLLAGLLLLCAAFTVRAENCSDYPGGVLDGYAGTPAPAQLQIDQNCTIRNYPADNPFDTNVSFYTQPGQNPDRWLVIFDNVVHTGQMSCDAVHQHYIWFVNGSLTGIHPGCQNYLIPVEKIDKQNPPGTTTVTVGVPFTYTLTMPVLYAPATGTVINSEGSDNDLHSATIVDDLNATGVALTYVSHVAYWRSSGTPVPHTFSNVGGVLTFDNFPIIPAGEQIIIEVTVVLDDSPLNAPGTQFVNTAKWDFGRLIDGVFYEPLPGESGISPPLTIAAPELVVTKTGPASMNLAASDQFGIDVHNTGLSAAYDVTVRDRLPDGATGGMCDIAPEILGAQVFAADGVTPVAGKGPLAAGTDYTLTWNGAPTCELTLTMLTPAGVIGADERLVVTYRTQLDAGSQNAASLTNVAGAVQWFNGDSSVVNRVAFNRTLTDGTVGTLDFQDAHTVTVALSGTFFEKTVADLTSGVNPATTAVPGDTLRYTLRILTTDQPLDNARVYDELDALNALPAFVPGSLTLVTVPAGANAAATSSTGGAKGTGVIDIRNISAPVDTEVLIVFDVTLAANVAEGSIVTNQSALRETNGTLITLSDDPYVNGASNPLVAGDEDPTRVLIQMPPLRFEKTVVDVTTGANPAIEARPGDTLRYTLRIENLSSTTIANFSLIDELDRLNATAGFAPGTLNILAIPAGADASNSSSTGGAKGTGLLDVRNLSLPGLNSIAVIEFEVTLVPVLANGSYVRNQSQLQLSGITFAVSDDPNVNGAADPAIFGDEDPTQVRIQSAPLFEVKKTSTYLTGDPTVLLAGETLRYTITVRNIGNDNATDAVLRDAIPVNTTYVAGSTTLNGATVADVSGTSPLVNGMQIHPPSDPAPGSMPVDTSGDPGNTATITFDVVVSPNVIDGTVISNQGFVSAPGGGVTDQPSDDPRTPIADDPTRDVVGNVPLLFAPKAAALLQDAGTPGIVDPGDVLRYTITIYNQSATPATGVTLRDVVPANTTYVADSMTLNGLPVGQPDGGVSPLIAGIDVSSSDLTPPLPAAGQGTLSGNASAIVQFDLRVNDGVPSGTIISNQAVVRTVEIADVLTDGDGNPATGPEPTIVVVGDAQQLTITKEVTVVGGGAALAGATLEYLVRVTNVAAVPAFYVNITDDLDMANPGYLIYVDQSAMMNGQTTGVTVAGSLITADYATAYGPLQPGEEVVLRFRARIEPTLAIGTRVTNTGVVTWNSPQQTASASVSIDVGGMPGSGTLNGAAWHDVNFDKVQDATERALEGWTVELYRNTNLIYSGVTDATGVYRIAGVTPNDLTTDQYELRFRAPGAGPTTALLGVADSPYTNDLQRISNITVASGSNLQGLNLPISPNGVVYDSVVRTPIAGATLRLLDPRSNAPLPASCLDDAAQQNQVTLADGWYRFDLNFSDPACPDGGDYLIDVIPPPAGYVAGISAIIPPSASAATPPFAVPSCPGGADDAIPTTPDYCEAIASELAPPVAVPARSDGTKYYTHLAFDGSRKPGTSQIYNNHLALDPVLDGAVTITKTTPLLNVTRGQLVPYVISLNNTIAIALTDVSIVDRFPAGFRYVEGSARLDGQPVEPTLNGRELVWSNLTIGASSRHDLLLMLAVGAGVSEGEFVNRAQAVNSFTGNALSGEATATVRVVPDPTFDCTDVTGKVYADANRNGLQDAGEEGLAGVRLVTTNGLNATTDAYGRFHITCAITPNEDRGSNFVLKLDDRTLPSGYRMSTKPVQVQRATRGKMLRFNFGASIHRVVGLDMADAVFEPGTTEMRLQWQPRINLLLTELEKAPAVLRLSYVADVEDPDLVNRRLEAVKKEIMAAWEALACCYELTIEPEVFWRLGAPPQQADLDEASGR
jgi:large repetitive protein